MGAIVPTITGLTNAIGAVETLVGAVQGFGGSNTQQTTDNSAEILRAQQRLALQQLKAQQTAQAQDLAEQTALSREKLRAEADAAEAERLAALRRAVARQRAAFGASGIGNTDGSSEAVLLGMFEETDQDRTESERLDDIRNRVLDQEQAAQERLNILQASQLRQKQQLERVVSEGSY
ncbi:MAG: hypothetical protein H6869_09255 [Rhodospirillales bacterium]|nr:hypothetical protein [Rhodospirillales bacterium]